MTITLADTRFSGPYSRFGFLEHRPGVWAVLDGRALPPIAAGAAEDVHDAIDAHPAREGWSDRCERPSVAVFYTSRPGHRERIMDAMRGEYGLAPLPASESSKRPHLVDEERAPRVRSERPARQDRDESSDVRAAS